MCKYKPTLLTADSLCSVLLSGLNIVDTIVFFWFIEVYYLLLNIFFKCPLAAIFEEEFSSLPFSLIEYNDQCLCLFEQYTPAVFIIAVLILLFGLLLYCPHILLLKLRKEDPVFLALSGLGLHYGMWIIIICGTYEVYRYLSGLL